MGRSVPRNIDRKGEHLSRCDVCGTPYLRSALRRGRDGLLRCSDDLPGRDAVTLSELTAQRAAGLAQRLGNISPADGAVPDELPVRVPERPFAPTDISAVSAWLSVAAATSDVNGVSSVPDLINANPAVQSVDARKPVIETSFGLPCMRFATNDVLSWPITPANGATQQWGVAFWMKPDALTGNQVLFITSAGTGGASAARLRLFAQTAGMTCDIYASGLAGRSMSAASSLSTAWQFVTLEYDSSRATEQEKATFTTNTTVRTRVFGNTGAGAAIGDLLTVTGNHLIGNANNGSASIPFNGLIGPHIYAFGSKMAGATEGVLTQAARLSLMLYGNPIGLPAETAPHVPGNGPYTGPTRRYTADQVYNGNVPTGF